MSETDPYGELKRFTSSKDWWSAREEIRRMLADPSCDANYLRQQLALCTYKDPELRRRTALDTALGLLVGQDSSAPEQVMEAETAGLAGAVLKRRWELDGREEHLRGALRWYERGAALPFPGPPDEWDGYLHINAAYVADILAHLRDDESSAQLRAKAEWHRRRVVERIDPATQRWWPTAALLEAHIGLGDRAGYLGLLDQVRRFSPGAGPEPGSRPSEPVVAWERESTATQLARLATVLATPPERADLTNVIAAVVPEAHPDAVATFGHRFGLALSGGGFRASLFHLGVLAALAEHDLLRPLEVLSCVSGGSIVGTAYYSAVAALLESKADAAICRADLVEVVGRCIETVGGTVTSRNLRMSAFVSPVTLVRGIRHGRWSRTRRSGMLYERYLYRPLRPGGNFATLQGLKVAPSGAVGLRPKVLNGQRGAKIPTLLINATSLGTGRPWRFTASSIGEPEDDGSDTDPIDRLEPIWFDRPGRQGLADRISVGDAVAASACVPGLFPPVRLRGLYPERTVALVDGGVFDNQGISGLLDHDCTEVFVSDASGLMGERLKPRSTLVSVLLRTNAVALNAVRGTTFGETTATVAGGSVRSAWTVHLLSGLPVNRIQPITAATAPQADPSVPSSGSSGHDPVFRALSELRTDLDRFTTAEAYALMARGYRLTLEAFERQPHPLAQPRVAESWPFLAIEPLLDDPAASRRLLRELEVGRKVFFKWLPRGRRPMPVGPT